MKRVVVCVAAMSVLLAGPSRGQALDPAQDSGVVQKQKALDRIASFALPTTAPPGAPYLPKGSFRSWSAKDQAAVPKIVARACEVFWVMDHDDPATHFLPKTQAPEDEEVLGSYVCLAGHMPADWPDRGKVAGPVRDIFQRAKALGSPLTLPPGLSSLAP